MTIRNKNTSFQATNLLDKLFDTNQLCFSIDKAYQLLPDANTDAVRRLLSDMTKRGLLMRVKDGLYYVIPYEQDPKTFMPDWHLLSQYLVGDSAYYIGYYSALQLHNLTTQPHLKEQIVVNKQFKPTTLLVKDVPFQFIYHNNKHFFGNKNIWIDNFNKVQSSDLEKTFIDCLFKPQYANSITEIAKAIYKAKDTIDYPKLLDYAKRFNAQAVIKRLGYLLELLKIESPVIEIMQKLRSNSFVALDPSYPKEGKTNFRWAIQQNIDSDSILSPIYS